jgi:hypothetical protein
MAGPYHDLPVFSRLGPSTPNYVDVFRPLRTLISLTVLAGVLWFSFAVELGDKTLAEHVDTISATPEAKQLLEGTRQTIDPALDDVRDRMLGEYVEAPTWIQPDEPVLAGSSAPEPALPGRRREVHDEEPDEAPPEPMRPGRRLRPNVLTTIEAEIEPATFQLEPTLVDAAPASIEPSAPTELPRAPWPRSHADDPSFLTPILELARSLPPAPEPRPIPIFHPVIDPELPELPGAR